MLFSSKQNPVTYLDETKRYIDDIQRVSLLRNNTKEADEKELYNTIIHCMQEVLLYMNSLTKKEADQLRLT